MKRTFALTIALALASLGMSAYAQTAPAHQGPAQTQSGKKHKKQHKQEKKQKEGHSSTQK